MLNIRLSPIAEKTWLMVSNVITETQTPSALGNVSMCIDYYKHEQGC